jgi:hypothetical protein
MCPTHLNMEAEPVSVTSISLVFRVQDDGRNPKPQQLLSVTQHRQIPWESASCAQSFLKSKEHFNSWATINFSKKVSAACSLVLPVHLIILIPRPVMWPPLWSSGQSSWLKIRRPGFDSRHYQKKKQWLWNGVHSASWVQLRSYLIEK